MKASPIFRAGFSLFAATFALSSIAEAAPLFSYDASNTYVTATQPYRNPDGTNWSSGDRAFSQTAALSPGSGYSGPAFIGGFSGSAGTITATALQNGVINNTSLGDVIDLHLTGTAAGASFNFLLGANISAVDVGSLGSAFSVTLSESKSTGGTATVRLALYDGTQWFLSDTSNSSTGTGTFVTNFTNIQNFTWETYDPSTNLAFSGSAHLAPDLSNVTAFAVLNNFTGVGSNTRGVLISALSVVPEPNTACLGVLGLGGLGLYLRRRKILCISAGARPIHIPSNETI